MIASHLDNVSASCPTSCTPVTFCPAVPEKRVHDPKEMCRYPSKKCWNLRVLKRNGERHNLCEFHRQKANKNQRRLELRRKARAQACIDAETPTTHLRAHKKQRQRTRRGPLSAHIAMKEEARAKADEMSRAHTVVSSGLTSHFLHDLVLLDGVYDQAGFQVKEEQPDASFMKPIRSGPTLTKAHDDEPLRLPDVVDDEVLDRILEDEEAEAAAVSKGLRSTSRVEALKLLPDGKTSPVDVGESWDTLDFSDYWLTPPPADQSTVSSDAQVFVVDENVLVADV